MFRLCLTALCLVSLSLIQLDAAKMPKWEQRSEKKFTPEHHYSCAINAYNKGQWNIALKHFSILKNKFRNAPLTQTINYHMGVAYFNIKNFDLSNQHFTQYLSQPHTPELFHDAIQYKFMIAERFRQGAKCHLFHKEDMPVLQPGRDTALEIYDEIIATLPTSELSIESHYAKSDVLVKMGMFEEAVEPLKKLIAIFPDEDLAIEAYLSIARVYCLHSQKEPQNIDLMALSSINLKNFEEHFPGEERISEARELLDAVTEAYANSLFDTGAFYEKIGKPNASVIYYKKTMSQFPKTLVAAKCQERLNFLCIPRDS